MRFSVEAAALKRAVALVSPVLPRRATVPILENVLLALSGDCLRITANDLDQGVTVEMTVAGEENGQTTVNGARLKSITDTAPAGAQISLSAAEDASKGAAVLCGRSRFRLAVLPVTEFPVPKPVSGIVLELQPGELGRILSASVCSSHEDARYYLNGVFLHRKQKELCATATDGHKLAHIPMSLPEGGEQLEDNPDGGGGYIIPNAALRQLSAMGADKACSLILTETAVEARIDLGKDQGPLIYRTRLVDGQFPSYSRVIPPRENFEGAALVNTEHFRAALKRCSVALSAVEHASSGRPKKAVALHFENNVLRVEATGALGEAASEEIDIEWSGASLRSGFNWRYLDLISEAVDSENLRFWPSVEGPSRFEPEVEDGRIYVVMPMRT